MLLRIIVVQSYRQRVWLKRVVIVQPGSPPQHGTFLGPHALLAALDRVLAIGRAEPSSSA